jgi:hypothetical protein
MLLADFEGSPASAEQHIKLLARTSLFASEKLWKEVLRAANH